MAKLETGILVDPYSGEILEEIEFKMPSKLEIALRALWVRLLTPICKRFHGKYFQWYSALPRQDFNRFQICLKCSRAIKIE